MHSLDASHAAGVINAARGTDERGFSENITVAVIHDCYSSLAPDVQRLHQIVHREFGMLYRLDHLGELKDGAWKALWQGWAPGQENCNDRAASAIKLYLEPMPQYGTLDPLEVQQSEYMTS